MRPLTLDQLHRDPIVQFAAWFAEAKRALGVRYPDAFCLSTVDPDGYPNGRMLLLKDHGERGFSFFTNEESAKGRALAAAPRASMTFYWDPLRRQIRIQGDVTELAAEESDEYFRTRPRDSQASAWASRQSRPLHSRAELEQRAQAVLDEHGEGEIPRPPHWKGFLVRPRRIEFWQERPARLHDRFEYAKGSDGRWNLQQLNP